MDGSRGILPMHVLRAVPCDVFDDVRLASLWCRFVWCGVVACAYCPSHASDSFSMLD